jgi:hypothetical protein
MNEALAFFSFLAAGLAAGFFSTDFFAIINSPLEVFLKLQYHIDTKVFKYIVKNYQDGADREKNFKEEGDLMGRYWN